MTDLDRGVDVVIVNWNSGDQLRECLESIALGDISLLRQVIVVDNGSTDGSARTVVPGLTVTIVEAGANLGFARACNVGAARATAPLLLFLNPDARVGATTLTDAARVFDQPGYGRLGVLGIKLIDENGVVQRHATDRPTARTMFTHEQRAVRFDHLESRRVHHVIGAFYLIRTALFRQIGGFDERFFVYLEDLDLSARVHDAGFDVFYHADASAFHKGGGVSNQVKAKRLFYSLRSRILYSFKHFRFREALAVTGLTLTVEPLARLVRAVVRRSGAEGRETIGAFVALYRDLPNIYRIARRDRPADEARAGPSGRP